MTRRFDLIVIGGGPAGVTAALRGAELGASVALLESGQLGGTCTNDGCAPMRVLAKAARLLRDAGRLGDYGISAVDPKLDIRALLSATQRTVYTLHEKKQLAWHLERAGVDVFEQVGDVAFTGPSELALTGGDQLLGDRIIVACGGHSRRLAFPGAELAMSYHDVWNLAELPRSIAIVGASSTGVQLASVLASFGSRVTLLELAPRILPGEDETVSAALSAAFAARGVQIRAGIGGVEGIERRGRSLQLGVRQGDQRENLAFDAVVTAVGWPGNLEALNLDAAGVATARGYIAVDDTLRTSAPNIWAAGDVTGRMMLVQSATLEGRIAAENAIRGDATEVRHTIVAHGGFTDPEYASIGLTEAQASGAGRSVVVGTVPYEDLDRAVIDGETDGFCSLVVDRDDHQILGAHVVGEQAAEVIQIVAATMAGGAPVERLAEIEFAYPTFTAIAGLAARQGVHALRLPGDQARDWEALGRPRVAEWERSERVAHNSGR